MCSIIRPLSKILIKHADILYDKKYGKKKSIIYNKNNQPIKIIDDNQKVIDNSHFNHNLTTADYYLSRSLFNYICTILENNKDIKLDINTLKLMLNRNPKLFTLSVEEDYLTRQFNFKRLAVCLKRNETLKKSNIQIDEIYQLLIDTYQIDNESVFPNLINSEQFKENHKKLDDFLETCNSKTFVNITNIIIRKLDENFDRITFIKKKNKENYIENLIISILILYGLCMGTISMVLFQRMYMLLTTFIMLYFYLSLKIYKNDFEFDKKLKIQLGIATVLGFLTQYFFAIYAFFIFAIMIVEMIRNNKQDKIPMYLGYHVLYALIGILLFVPCLKHLLFSDRGLTNLGNTGYFDHLLMYLKHLAYAFNINQNLPLLIGIIFTLFAIGTVYYFVKSKDKFIPCMLVIPSIFYFLIAVKMTSFQELRYIMAVIPFVVLTFFFILDDLITVKYKDIIFAIMAIVIVSIGFISSKPKFLYENYKEILDIANSNSEKSFVYVYDNFFNHMQSVPEMMVYEKTLIINYNNGELDVVVNDESLKNEDSFILSIKSYMDNDTILNELKDKSDFKNIANIYQIENNSEVVGNNYYLVSK